uniref:Uncharacterized protein n=1 Tax=Globisporangium ultimum (strain ATCC 200006 / CBS 805.95 / DAOM BR144) TaxID=431595 RepID=K3W502_GLOUD
MKTFAAVGVGLLLTAAQRAAGAMLEFNKALASSNNGISFQSDDVTPLPAKLLMGAAHYDDGSRLQCTNSHNVTNDMDVKVLIAVSKCLNDSSIAMIKDWVNSVDSSVYYEDGLSKKLKFDVAVVPGACEERTEKEKHGLGGGGSPPAIETRVLESDLERFVSLSPAGSDSNPVPITSFGVRYVPPVGVISFVNDQYSFTEVKKFELEFKVSAVFNFQICEGGESCQGRFENCIQLFEAVDIYAYNPFTVARTLDCSRSLTGGIPISYVEDDGKRHCFCSCPAGSKMVESENGYSLPSCSAVPSDVCPCVWSNHQEHGYRIGIDQPKTGPYDVCEIKQLASEHGIPVPFPTDNYVADNRRNAKDADNAYVSGLLKDGPHVKVATLPLNNVVFDGDAIPGLPLPKDCTDLPTTTDAFISQYGNGKNLELPQPYGQEPEQSRYSSWSDYQTKRQNKIDELSYHAYGKYSLELEAKDYSDEATCKGCLAIVDDYRPRNTTVCPVGFCDNTTSVCGGRDAPPTSELTIQNLFRAQGLVTQYFDFATKALNDRCTSEKDNRCDEQCFKQKDIFQGHYSEGKYSEGADFFSIDATVNAFLGNDAAKVSPLTETVGYETVVKQSDEPVRPGQCTRCANLRTKLQEYWVDYKCGYDYDIRRCSGDDDQTCQFEQCLVVNGDTFVDASATIKPDVVAESEKVLAQLVQKGFQTYTQVHRAVDCSDLNGPEKHEGECSFTSKISNLIDVNAQAKPEIGHPDVSPYVFWRYKVGNNGEWKLFGDDCLEKFTSADTRVYVEAWTQCGVTRKFLFSVNLHAHTDVHVCDEFPNMWYQSSVSRLPITHEICTYSGSDFAELTFDYHPNIGLRYSRDRLSLNVTQVECSLAFNDHTPAQLLHVEQESPEIISRFAIEALNNDVTAEKTPFNITCKFTYTRYDATTVKKKCKRRFEIKDCTKPEIDNPPPPQGECAFDECGGDGLPGPFEACGGTIVKSSPGYEAEGETMKAQTTVVTGGGECCQKCESYQLSCNALLNLPNAKEDISRCEPVSNYGYGDSYGNSYGDNYGNSYTTALMSAGHALLNAGQQNTDAAALLGASALIALVALVVVKRRRNAAATKLDTVEDDAYYPLLS